MRLRLLIVALLAVLLPGVPLWAQSGVGRIDAAAATVSGALSLEDGQA